MRLPKDKVEGALLLDVVVREGPRREKFSSNLKLLAKNRPAILKLLASKDQPLLIRRNPFLVLDLGFHILDCVGWLDLETKILHFWFYKMSILEIRIFCQNLIKAFRTLRI